MPPPSRLLPNSTLHPHTQVGVGQVIRGWDDTLPQMSRGQIVKLVCPPHYGYGERGYPPVIPPHATLIFQIELISFH